MTGQVKEEDHYEEIEYGLPISWDDASVAQYDGLAAKTDLLWDDDGTPSQNPDSDEQWSKEHQQICRACLFISQRMAEQKT